MFTLYVVSFYIHADINECSSNPCVNGGTCVDQVNAYVCNCTPGYAGVNCQTGKYFIIFQMYAQLAGLVQLSFQFLSDGCYLVQLQWFEEPLSEAQ